MFEVPDVHTGDPHPPPTRQPSERFSSSRPRLLKAARLTSAFSPKGAAELSVEAPAPSCCPSAPGLPWPADAFRRPSASSAAAGPLLGSWPLPHPATAATPGCTPPWPWECVVLGLSPAASVQGSASCTLSNAAAGTPSTSRTELPSPAESLVARTPSNRPTSARTAGSCAPTAGTSRTVEHGPFGFSRLGSCRWKKSRFSGASAALATAGCSAAAAALASGAHCSLMPLAPSAAMAGAPGAALPAGGASRTVSRACGGTWSRSRTSAPSSAASPAASMPRRRPASASTAESCAPAVGTSRIVEQGPLGLVTLGLCRCR
mmetsp:Transcript_43067/g.136913  ORF Transcript_43067/g.136913 Transcript_43067/m.136913 type:complete len:319 (+) Transcript_43067:93-1049(+)